MITIPVLRVTGLKLKISASGSGSRRGGGRIWVKSQVGVVGFTFTFTIPVRAGE
jgi:signal transduction histidine kinase